MILSLAVLAGAFPEENFLPQDEPLNPALQGLSETIAPFVKQLSLLVGGIFGLYLILLVVRIYYERRLLRLLQDIRYDLDQLNRHYRLPYSHIRKSFLGKILRFTFHTFFSSLRSSRGKK